ncbi:3-isopropylmalate dehydratase large subunit [Candidatus Nitrosocosmicus oleophilus]|uniref:3-isopropylmalate dehydratase n=1 Tax=Candidatus Nitrosocosmicus oleophilus TaxID=1353260 RepID=A0A654LV12_9ARCH|nr:3-isopropylmalate dehydratase large subunit [Candidatus Nitrosocosmicus oleophilus]ALI35035.1 3-isopropylmalate dehydratase large subunit [Candidatus Nitrosocosmicus oleophilus]
MAQTLYDKIWDNHVVYSDESSNLSLLYIDRHYVHEVTSPQAFDGLRINERKVRRPDLTFATVDHNVPTTNRSLPIVDQISSLQIKALENNCKEFGIKLFDIHDKYQGIVHVIGPELGLTLPGSTIVCGDSHTSTHGAFGSLAFGIGTSEVEHVLATQCLWMKKSKNFEIVLNGGLKQNQAVTSKDVILNIIRKIGTSGGSGSVIEYKGNYISSLTMEKRMTICNMSIEAGARAGLVAPDDVTFEYLRGRVYTPKNELFDQQIDDWKNLRSDNGAQYDKTFSIDIDNLAPQVTWGTNPAMTTDVDSAIPSPDEYSKGNDDEKKSAIKALEYMNLKPGLPITDISVDRVFIGSCTNARLEDLIEASNAVKGKKVSSSVKAMVVPGSQQVKIAAEKLGLDKIFINAGFEWREPGCSMCLGMNPDILQAGERCASTSNRNFEGRQGTGGRTHLVSPFMAAAAAIAGKFVDVREWV